MNIDRSERCPSAPALALPDERSPATVSALEEWLSEAVSSWRSLLLERGAILFRGFGVRTPEQLARIAVRTSARLLPYTGGNSPRTRLGTNVYTSTEYPADQQISLHNELSYARAWPARVLFACQVPPRRRGETPIADGRLALSRLSDGLVARFVERKLAYTQNLHGGVGIGRSWQATFETQDEREVEQFLRAQGADFEWKGDGGLRIWYRRDAVHVHPETGDLVWFNQADQWHPSNLDAQTRGALESLLASEDLPTNVTFGDGSAISDEDMRTVRDTLWGLAYEFPWAEGDLLIVDNVRTVHGRRPFVGPRRILVAMT